MDWTFHCRGLSIAELVERTQPMMRWTCLLLTILAFSGCQRIPRFDPLSGFGATRVTPPATNSYGVANRYYQRSPNEQSNIAPTAFDSAVTANEPIGSRDELQWSPVRNGQQRSDYAQPIIAEPLRQIATVAHEAPVYEPSIRIIESSRPTRQSLNLKGIPISDATSLSQPRQFVPSRDVFAMPADGRSANSAVGTGISHPQPAGRIATQVSPNQTIWHSRYER
ncbi:MAG: hypothetical protein ACI9HK_000964 [Pirellulaceae bacterium]|jgi:hypothetical protein